MAGQCSLPGADTVASSSSATPWLLLKKSVFGAAMPVAALVVGGWLLPPLSAPMSEMSKPSNTSYALALASGFELGALNMCSVVKGFGPMPNCPYGVKELPPPPGIMPKPLCCGALVYRGLPFS